MGVGLLIGALIPRYTEGVLIIIALFSIGMSVQEEAAKLFPHIPGQVALPLRALRRRAPCPSTCRTGIVDPHNSNGDDFCIPVFKNQSLHKFLMFNNGNNGSV